MRHPMTRLPVLLLPLIAAFACDAPLDPMSTTAHDARAVTSSNGNLLSPDLCASDRDDFSLTSANDYFPLGVGSEWRYSGEEDGEEVELRITVADETETIGAVVTRVVEEREWIGGTLVEFSRNFVVATAEGAICYFGEDVDIFEDGGISHDGAWRADAAGNSPGILLPPSPRPGMRFTMEGAPGIAEDQGRIVGAGPVRTPAGEFRETIRVREFNPLDGGFGFKHYAKHVGLVSDAPVLLDSYTVTGP